MDRKTIERRERVFLTHPDGTGEIYNLQLVKESELPEVFRQFMFTHGTDTDDNWMDAADRWCFFDATNLTEEQIEEILETHNEDCERILERGDFQSFRRVGIGTRWVE